ncbi:MAG: T9SS type A sorting domain-containing protein, partial [Bacteroidales bacterium]|nr:T9SS type A sorting domain-containing protein [Bacteroidales bacterium]
AVQAGVESTIAITTSTGNYPYTFVIWVDFDNSLSFEDSEIVYIGKASSGAGTHNATITVPADQALGDYRMRIYGADSYFNSFYNNGNTNWDAAHDPCASGGYRHANDYTLRVLEAPSCPMPTELAINYTGGTTATVTWEGTAETYNIDVNGTVINNVTTPYTLENLELATTYAVKVQANCENNETSDWTATVSFATDFCMPENQCEITFELTDSYGDGWNGGAGIRVIDVETNAEIGFMTNEDLDGESGYGNSELNTLTLAVCDGREIQFVWVSGSYDDECSYVVKDANGVEIFSGQYTDLLDEPVNYVVNCSAPVPVCTITLDENNEWSQNFDNLTTATAGLTGTTMGECWTWNRLVELPTGYVDTVPQIYNRSAFAHSGDYSLLLWHRGVYAMPELDSTININELKMSFYLRQSYSFYTLLVGVMTDPTDPETFEPIAHIDNGSSTGVEYAELSFANYQGEGRYIAFKNVRPTATEFDGDWNDIHSVNYIDDIKLSLREEGDCVTGLPYEQNFDGVTLSTNALTGAMPECWEMVQNDLDEEIPFDKMPQVYCKSSFANSGNYSLRMVNRCVYAMPMLADTIDMSKVQLSMSVRQPNARYQLYVGVWSDGEFYPVALVDNATTGYEDFSCDFSKYDGPAGRIAFRNVLSKGKSYDYSYNYIDDIVVSLGETPVCDAVTSLNVTESFEDYTQSTVAATGVMPTCWEVVEKDVEMAFDKYPQVYNNPNFAGTGDYSLVMIDRCVIAMPELEDGIELNDVTLTMKLRQPNTQYQLEVGVWEVGYDENQEPIEQFVPVATFHNADNTVTEVSCDFASYTGNSTRIAFRNTLKTANYNYSYNYLDDITLTLTEAKIAASSNANVIDEMDVENYLESIAIYPNPTVGELHIGAVDVQKVECYNQMGQLVAVYNNDRDINISALADGVYTLRITVPQGVTMRKVVKR